MKSKQEGGGQYTIQRVMGKTNSSHIKDDDDLVVVVNDITTFESKMQPSPSPPFTRSNAYKKLQDIIHAEEGYANISLKKYIGHFVHIIDRYDSDRDRIALTYKILPPVDAAAAAGGAAGGAVATTTGGKSHKSHKSRKTHKTRKSRKSHKSRKTRKTRKTRKH